MTLVPILHPDARWLVCDLLAPHQCLSWALVGHDLQQTSRVVWHAVHNRELPLGVDPEVLLRQRLQAANLLPCVALMTSANLRTFVSREASVDACIASCVATVGLSNAVHVAFQPTHAASIGPLNTINTVVCVNQALTPSGLLEALSIAVEARTAAVMQAQVEVAPGQHATGTGTDCMVILAPLPTRAALGYAGKHTAIGQAVGQATFAAVSQGAQAWRRAYAARLSP